MSLQRLETCCQELLTTTAQTLSKVPLWSSFEVLINSWLHIWWSHNQFETPQPDLCCAFKIYLPLTAVDSHDVWGYLEECDIFNAAKIVAQSRIFQEAYRMSIHRNTAREGESTFQLCRFFAATSVKEISLGCERGSIVGAAQLYSGCTSVAFLSQVRHVETLMTLFRNFLNIWWNC